MKTFDVQGIDLDVPRNAALTFIADPTLLPAWTRAFASVSGGRAVMRTPDGEVGIDLEVHVSTDEGTVDWRMKFPDGSMATAFSRVVAVEPDRCIYCFTLTRPPVPLEQLEGALDAQSRTLAQELRVLKKLLEHAT